MPRPFRQVNRAQFAQPAPAALNFRRESASTDCPGSSLRKADIIAAVEQLGADPNADAPTPDGMVRLAWYDVYDE